MVGQEKLCNPSVRSFARSREEVVVIANGGEGSDWARWVRFEEGWGLQESQWEPALSGYGAHPAELTYSGLLT